jgi:isoleucyl-tRNA synthetase
VSDTLGAEILRLWIASTDYSGELSLSDEILKRVTEAYRRIRNTLRFLMANVADFNPQTDAVPLDQMLEMDRYAMVMTARWQQSIEDDLARFEFHPVVAKLQTFCSEDLGAFYLDILKDRLYTMPAASAGRRSAQTALFHITDALLKLMAPILSFTAEEAWPIFAPAACAAHGETIFTQTWHQWPQVADGPALLDKWERIRAVRARVLRQLETVRTDGKIGSSLQATVTLAISGADHDLLASLGEDLRFVLITSGASLTRADGEAAESIGVSASADAKCERCWHQRADVGADPARPGLCGRCASNLFGSGERRLFA